MIIIITFIIVCGMKIKLLEFNLIFSQGRAVRGVGLLHHLDLCIDCSDSLD